MNVVPQVHSSKSPKRNASTSAIEEAANPEVRVKMNVEKKRNTNTSRKSRDKRVSEIGRSEEKGGVLGEKELSKDFSSPSDSPKTSPAPPSSERKEKSQVLEEPETSGVPGIPVVSTLSTLGDILEGLIQHPCCLDPSKSEKAQDSQNSQETEESQDLHEEESQDGDILTGIREIMNSIRQKPKEAMTTTKSAT